jgi:hypothetical protein
MIHPDIQAALFRERSAALLAAAAAYRRGRQARLRERSRRMRFPGRKTKLTGAGLRYYTDVDHHGHEALGTLDDVRADVSAETIA